jgi:hypothetical protein
MQAFQESINQGSAFLRLLQGDPPKSQQTENATLFESVSLDQPKRVRFETESVGGY